MRGEHQLIHTDVGNVRWGTHPNRLVFAREFHTYILLYFFYVVPKWWECGASMMKPTPASQHHDQREHNEGNSHAIASSYLTSVPSLTWRSYISYSINMRTCYTHPLWSHLFIYLLIISPLLKAGCLAVLAFSEMSGIINVAGCWRVTYKCRQKCNKQ